MLALLRSRATKQRVRAESRLTYQRLTLPGFTCWAHVRSPTLRAHPWTLHWSDPPRGRTLDT